jgi:hypothetical protein
LAVVEDRRAPLMIRLFALGHAVKLEAAGRGDGLLILR